MSNGAGHVFLVPGDIRRLDCDAWALPCDGSGRIEPSWLAWPPEAARGLGPAVAFPHWSRAARRVRRVEGWPVGLPEPWLVHVELDPLVPSSWLVEGLVAFVREAAQSLKRRRPRHGRSAPLVAVPVGVAGIGAAEGDRARRAAGALVQELLPELRTAAAFHGLDVAIVAHSDDSLAAAQAARQVEGGARWDLLPAALRTALEPVTQAIRHRSLVLVSGARMGERLGLPTWSQLLERLAETTGASEDWRQAAARLPEAEHTRLVLARMGGKAAFCRGAAERLSLPHHGLGHALAAGLRADPLLCVAADDQLAQASAAAGRPPDVILDGPSRPGGPRLIQLLGSPQQPTTLLSARIDELRRRERELCLAAATQAALPPDPHVLVLGLEEPAELLRVVGLLAPLLPPGPGRLTILTEGEPVGLPALLPASVAWVPLVGPGEGAAAARSAGRRLELLLDLFGAAAATSGRFLDPGLRGLLPEAEQSLARAIDDMVVHLPARARSADGWLALRAWLAARGHPGE